MNATAEAILAAHRQKRALVPLGADAPADFAAGYAAQRAVAERCGAVPPAGFKIGATTRKMQEYLGLNGPAGGFVQAGNLCRSPATLPFDDYTRPGVECEVVVRLGRDLPHGRYTAVEAGAAVAEVFAGIELVENRYADLAALGTPTLIADSVFQAAAIHGSPARGWPGLDLAATHGRLLVDGTVRGEGKGAELLGNPLEGLAWLAASDCARVHGGLRAGQVVFLGSVTLPIWLDGPCHVTADFDTLGKAELRLT